MAYIKAVKIENCRNVQSLDVDLSAASDSNRSEQSPIFKHLVFTGPNGSGKSSVLKAMAGCLEKSCLAPWPPSQPEVEERLGDTLLTLFGVGSISEELKYARCTDSSKHVELNRNYSPAFCELWERGEVLLAYIPPRNRRLEQAQVNGPRKLGINLDYNLPSASLGNLLWQFLVNKHTDMTYAKADEDQQTYHRIEIWFDKLLKTLRRLMEDDRLEMRYERRAYSFTFIRGDGYQFDLNTLADGHAAVFGVLAEILLRIECIQSTKNDFTFEPEGIVIIDEIEAHLHLSLQEQILPLLTTLFPKLQFIVATHSPAVIASIPGAVVYDLKKQIQIPSDEYRGIPYGMLMTGHFGISSDIDLDSTQKLVRLRELAQKSQRSEHEDNEFNQLAQILSDRSSILANEVWMIKEKLSATSIQLAGE